MDYQGVATFNGIPGIPRNRDDGTFTTPQRGTVVPVRTDEAIEVERSDNRIYKGVVDQDVRGDDGRLAIPHGSDVELIVRRTSNNDLIIDIGSVMTDEQRYAVKTDQKRIESQGDDSLVGGIVGAIRGSRSRSCC